MMDAAAETRADPPRKAKDYKTGDIIRSKLSEMGIIIEDKPEGTRWKIS